MPVPKYEDASVSSGLEALQILDFNDEAMDTLTGNGQQIAEFVATHGAELVVNMNPLVVPEPICRTFDEQTGDTLLRFPYTNRHTGRLEVTSESLNELGGAVSGTPVPATIFESSDLSLPIGYYGYELPMSLFTSLDSAGQEYVSAFWKLLGKQQRIDSPARDVAFCSLEGTLRECTPMTAQMNNRIIDQAMSAISSLSKEAVKARKTGRWKVTGKFRTPYLSRSAAAIRSMRALLGAVPANSYICPTQPPPSCLGATFPKAALTAEFDSILKVKLPKGLRHLQKRYPSLRKDFLLELNRHPDSYTYCPSQR